MRTFLTIAAFFAFSCAHALAGAILIGDISSALIGQYVAVIAFLAGVAGVLAKIVQSLYQRIIDDKEKRIADLQARIDELTKKRGSSHE